MPTYAYRGGSSPRIWHRHGEQDWHWASDNHPDNGASHRAENASEPIWVPSRYSTYPRYNVPEHWITQYRHDMLSYVGTNKRGARNHQAAVNPVTGEWEWKPIDRRAFGVEIECFMPIDKFISEARRLGLNVVHREYTHETTSYWKLVNDGSIELPDRLEAQGYGKIEVVSPKLIGGSGIEQLRGICKALETVDARVNATTGLHIHHDARDLTLNAYKLIAVNYAAAQEAFNMIVSPSRRNNRFAHAFEWHELRRIERATQKGRVMSQEYSDRYKVVNLGFAYKRHGTIEFRQHQGTTEFRKISAWIMLGKALIEASRKGKVIPQNMALEATLEAITDDRILQNYYNQRAAQIARRE